MIPGVKPNGYNSASGTDLLLPGEYLKKPYTYCLVWDEESKTWTGTVKEFPGCVAQGDTWAIMFDLRRAACNWIAAALDLGQEIPEVEVRAWEGKG